MKKPHFFMISNGSGRCVEPNSGIEIRSTHTAASIEALILDMAGRGRLTIRGVGTQMPRVRIEVPVQHVRRMRAAARARFPIGMYWEICRLSIRDHFRVREVITEIRQ